MFDEGFFREGFYGELGAYYAADLLVHTKMTCIYSVQTPVGF